MKTQEIAIAGEATDRSIVKTVEAAAKALGLRVALRTTTRTYPGSTHWHFKRTGELRGTLELTYWPETKRLWAKIHQRRRAKWIAGGLAGLAEEINGRLAKRKGVGERLLDKDSSDGQYRGDDGDSFDQVDRG